MLVNVNVFLRLEVEMMLLALQNEVKLFRNYSSWRAMEVTVACGPHFDPPSPKPSKPFLTRKMEFENQMHYIFGVFQKSFIKATAARLAQLVERETLNLKVAGSVSYLKTPVRRLFLTDQKIPALGFQLSLFTLFTLPVLGEVT